MWTFNPILKTTIWGGDKIAGFKGIQTDLTEIGESWELSGVEGSESVVAEGPDKGKTLSQLIDEYGARLMGEKNFARFGNRFPLLIKFIDAREDLSVQVHPDDEIAQRHGQPNGKTEMWYVLSSEEGARLANGFRHPVDPADYERLVETGEIEDVLNFNTIHKGETYFIPAGRVHAIGKGAFVAEVQQTSDATYRLYDYHRKDKNGNERELHTALAREAINFNDTAGNKVEYTPAMDIPVNLVRSPFFTTNLLRVDHELMRDYRECDTFVVIIATEGSATIHCGDRLQKLHHGNTLLIPASARGITIVPDGTFSALETYIK